MLDFRTGKLAGWPQKSISSGNYGTVNEGIVLNKEVIWDDYLEHITKDILREKFWEKCQLLLKFMLAILDLYLGHRERKWKWKSVMEKNSGVGSLSLLHRIFPTQGYEPRSLTLQAGSLPPEPQGKPKHPGMGSLSLLQHIFLTRKNQGHLRCMILYQLSYQGGPRERKEYNKNWKRSFTQLWNGLESPLKEYNTKKNPILLVYTLSPLSCPCFKMVWTNMKL